MTKPKPTTADTKSESGVLPGTPAGEPAKGPGIVPGTPDGKRGPSRDEGRDTSTRRP
jgi:hypothetical protein